jgi:hypothetical protein
MIQTKELVVTTLIAAIAAIMITPPIAYAQSPHNIAAGDQFLQQQVRTIDNNVHSFEQQQRDQASAIIIHWDEDYNNLSTGIGHDGEGPHNPHP